MDINEILDCMGLLRIPVKKNSVLWKSLLDCIDTSSFLLARLADSLESELEDDSMNKVEMIDEYTTDLEGYVAQQFVSTVMMSGKALNRKLRTIIKGFINESTGSYDEVVLSNSLKACNKFRRFLTRNKQFIQNQPEYSRILYRFIRYGDILREKIKPSV
ncbi:hypothetical protein SteCoe_27148 [Stentor coeruleus]|uniref:Uncharacterized protein n=1 Tax=Stentor coeruleus TaxID=5963 RepID=A0A1R2BBP8_9CILI|nr:hypothetical protein SteCoe_27148 [Stentor coeruleus]